MEAITFLLMLFLAFYQFLKKIYKFHFSAIFFLYVKRDVFLFKDAMKIT